MTADERTIIDALAGCSFLPGTTPKRFVRDMAARADTYRLTDAQTAYLWAIAWSWRRQLSRENVRLALRYSGGPEAQGVLDL